MDDFPHILLNVIKNNYLPEIDIIIWQRWNQWEKIKLTKSFQSKKLAFNKHDKHFTVYQVSTSDKL